MSEELVQKAVRKKLRFVTNKGEISVEDLYDLTLDELNETAKYYNRQVKLVEEEDFLKETNVTNTDTLLRFNIVIHVLNTKKQEQADRIKAAENRETKEKLMEALVRKEDEELDGMTKKQLEKAINKL